MARPPSPAHVSVSTCSASIASAIVADVQVTFAFPGVHTNPSQHIDGRLAEAPHCCARSPSPAQLLGSMTFIGKVGMGTGKVGMGNGKVGIETGAVTTVEAEGAGGGTSVASLSCSAISSGVQHLMCRLPPDRLLHSSPSQHKSGRPVLELPQTTARSPLTAQVVVSPTSSPLGPARRSCATMGDAHSATAKRAEGRNIIVLY
mmetsp:Transcript_6092/g.17056  ORF Transcript_6092/g.17056 Transcript_6092/m.17056 type:complete len:203 (+) Transcript_6092:2033-2641(+)